MNINDDAAFFIVLSAMCDCGFVFLTGLLVFL